MSVRKSKLPGNINRGRADIQSKEIYIMYINNTHNKKINIMYINNIHSKKINIMYSHTDLLVLFTQDEH